MSKDSYISDLWASDAHGATGEFLDLCTAQFRALTDTGDARAPYWALRALDAWLTGGNHDVPWFVMALRPGLHRWATEGIGLDDAFGLAGKRGARNPHKNARRALRDLDVCRTVAHLMVLGVSQTDAIGLAADASDALFREHLEAPTIAEIFPTPGAARDDLLAEELRVLDGAFRFADGDQWIRRRLAAFSCVGEVNLRRVFGDRYPDYFA